MRHVKTIRPTVSEKPVMVYKINPNLEINDKNKLHKLLQKYDHVFAKHDNDLGCTDVLEHHMDITSDQIISSAPYQTSPRERDMIWEHLSKLLECGVIRPSLSPYSSPVS